MAQSHLGASDVPNSINGTSKRQKKKKNDEDPQEQLYFGKLTECLQSQVDVLRPASAALLTISNVFQNYRSEIEGYDREVDALKKKDEKIEDLKAALRYTQSDKDEEIASLKERLGSIEDERKRLYEEKIEFELNRETHAQEHQRRKESLEEKDSRLKDGYRDKIKRAKEAIKNETQDRITQLQTTNEELIKKNVALEEKLENAEQTSKSKEEDWNTLRSSYKADNQMLLTDLDSIQKDFLVETHEDKVYTQRFVEIRRIIKEAAAGFFSALPKDPLEKRKTFEALDKPCQIVEYAFLSESSTCTDLRHAVVEYIIGDTIRELIWQPFAPAISQEEPALASLFRSISESLASNQRVESTWRAFTISGLQNSTRRRDELQRIDGRIHKLLAPFRDPVGGDEFSKTLLRIIQKATEVWDMAQRDTRPLFTDKIPKTEDKKGWMREDEDLYEDGHGTTTIEAGTHQSMIPLCIFPRIFRDPPTPGPELTVFQGQALFDDSPLLAMGRVENLGLQKVLDDAKRNFVSQKTGESGLLSRSERRMSMAAQMSHNGSAV